MARLLNDIIAELPVLSIHGTVSGTIERVVFDSRQAQKGDLFVAVRGTRTDGHQYIPEVIAKGVRAIVCEQPGNPQEDITWIVVENSARALGFAASAFYDHPSKKLKVIGITGTNGKTTTVFLLWQLFSSLGYKCGLLSTIENYIGQVREPSTHTTADAVQINRNIAAMADAGCEYCFMEMSSHAIDQDRIAGLKIHGAIFSNITHDHLDYHQNFSNYLKAKKKLFDELPAEAFALINVDDRHGPVMIQNCKAKHFTYALKTMADFRAKIVESHLEGLLLEMDQQQVWCRLAGTFNAYNLLAVYAVARIEGYNSTEILPLMSKLVPVQGRFEVISSPEGPTAIVDYAHTPDALKNVLQTIHEVRQSGQRIITVIGAGGDRDRLKRPLLARVACQLSDQVILTSDNPRSEDPEEILKEMEAGLDPVMRKKAVKITDRREAIRTAMMISLKGDIVLVAGKGHETYQEIKGVKYHFDDREVIRNYIQNLQNDN